MRVRVCEANNRPAGRSPLRLPDSLRSICLRQIAFVPNAGRAMLVPTQRHGKNVGTRIARPCLRSKQSPGRAISLRFSNPVRWICLRQIAFVPNAGRAMLVPVFRSKRCRLRHPPLSTVNSTHALNRSPVLSYRFYHTRTCLKSQALRSKKTVI